MLNQNKVDIAQTNFFKHNVCGILKVIQSNKTICSIKLICGTNTIIHNNDYSEDLIYGANMKCSTNAII